jgi:hypothetical protein
MNRFFRWLKDQPRNIKYGVKNIIDYFPIIWKDRDWDHYYLYRLLRYKLERMEKLQREHGHHVDHIKTADEIKVCKLLLDRLIKDDYLMNVMEPHDKKWGESEWNFTPCEDNPEFSELHFTHPNANTEEEIELEKKERIRLYKHSNNLRSQDLDMLFKLLRKQVEGWWD